jgi:hypothetical protein
MKPPFTEDEIIAIAVAGANASTAYTRAPGTVLRHRASIEAMVAKAYELRPPSEQMLRTNHALAEELAKVKAVNSDLRMKIIGLNWVIDRTKAPLPDPKLVQYRLLSDGEERKIGDEYLNAFVASDSDWLPLPQVSIDHQSTYSSDTHHIHRRRLP